MNIPVEQLAISVIKKTTKLMKKVEYLLKTSKAFTES